MRRLALFVLLLLLPSLALCESAPLTLPSATSAEEVEQFLLMPLKFAVSGVKPGYIRYISQNSEQDPNFRKRYWLGGEIDSELDLTLKKRGSIQYPFHTGTMCSRAAYSMALSYLGVDMTPGDMSRLMNARDLAEPYDMITEALGLERSTASRTESSQISALDFNAMFDRYLRDPSYSPPYLYFRRPNGTCHSVLIVAREPDTGRFLVVDSNGLRTGGHLYRVYFISLNPRRDKIVNSTFDHLLNDSTVLQVHQWHLPQAQE